jgi:hypothetical protein
MVREVECLAGLCFSEGEFLLDGAEQILGVDDSFKIVYLAEGWIASSILFYCSTIADTALFRGKTNLLRGSLFFFGGD